MDIKAGVRVLVNKGLGFDPLMWVGWRKGSPITGEPGAASLEFIRTFSFWRPQALAWFRRSWLSIYFTTFLDLSILICEKRINHSGPCSPLRDAAGKRKGVNGA